MKRLMINLVAIMIIGVGGFSLIVPASAVGRTTDVKTIEPTNGSCCYSVLDIFGLNGSNYQDHDYSSGGC